MFGPYKRKDGRSHVVFYDTETKKRRTQSYPRYLMEQHLGRELLPEEQVDHINNDRTDDRIENFQLLSQADNMKECVCPTCEKTFTVFTRRYVGNQIKQKKSGPYCSMVCVRNMKK